MSITFERLKERTLTRAQMEEDDPGAAELGVYVNEGCKYVRALLRQYRPSGYFVKSTSTAFVTVAGTPAVALPATLEALEGVDVQVGGRWYTAFEGSFADRNQYGQNKPWSVTEDGRINAWYTVQGDAIVFLDPPDAIYNGRFWMTEAYVDLVDGGSINLWGYEQLAIDYAAQMCLDDDEIASAHLDKSIFRWEQKIAKLAKRRDRSGHRAARDVTGATANLRDSPRRERL